MTKSRYPQGRQKNHTHKPGGRPPQKADPNRICITAEGNLIQCDCELSVPTADIDTAKLHWNNVISTALAKYMCMVFFFTYKLPWNITNT